MAGPVLDCGCGNKPYAALFERTRTRLIGVDIEQSSRSRADVLMAREGSLPFRRDSFEGALCTQVIEHVPDPHGLLEEVWRVLKPGGLLLLTAPFVWEQHELPHDYLRFTEMGMRRLAIDAGFHVLTLDGCGGFWETIGQLVVNRIPRWPYADVFLVAPCNWLFDRLDRWFKMSGITCNWQMVLRCEKN